MIFTTKIDVTALEWAIDKVDFEDKLGCSESLIIEYKHYIDILIRKYKNKSRFGDVKIDIDENNDDIYCLIECCNEEFNKYIEELRLKWEESQHPFNSHSPISQEQFEAETREFARDDEISEMIEYVQEELKKKGWR